MKKGDSTPSMFSGFRAPTRKPIGARKRFRVLQKCGFTCVYCGRTASEVRLEIDHVIPVSQGGTNDEANLTAACVDCNRGRGAMPIDGTFCQWLSAQQLRDDVVGDLADGHARDPLREPKLLRDLVEQIAAFRGIEDAKRAAWHAWREWRSGRPTKLVLRQRAELLADIRGAATEDEYCFWIKRGFWSAGVFYPYQRKER